MLRLHEITLPGDTTIFQDLIQQVQVAAEQQHQDVRSCFKLTTCLKLFGMPLFYIFFSSVHQNTPKKPGNWVDFWANTDGWDAGIPNLDLRPPKEVSWTVLVLDLQRQQSADLDFWRHRPWMWKQFRNHISFIQYIYQILPIHWKLRKLFSDPGRCPIGARHGQCRGPVRDNSTPQFC